MARLDDVAPAAPRDEMPVSVKPFPAPVLAPKALNCSARSTVEQRVNEDPLSVVRPYPRQTQKRTKQRKRYEQHDASRTALRSEGPGRRVLQVVQRCLIGSTRLQNSFNAGR